MENTCQSFSLLVYVNVLIVYFDIHLFIHSFVRSSVRLFVYLLMYLFFHLSIYLIIYLVNIFMFGTNKAAQNLLF